MEGIPIIPMVRILKQYATAHDFPLDIRNWESIVRCFLAYKKDAEYLN